MRRRCRNDHRAALRVSGDPRDGGRPGARGDLSPAAGAGFHTTLYDGAHLPYPDGHFTAVMSAHIIEHTPSPESYLREHMRVLSAGGWMFLEFPNRYHLIELHTGQPSVEFLPAPMRSLVLRFLTSRFSPLAPRRRHDYQAIQQTLQPVGLWQVRRYIRRMSFKSARVAHHYAPLPGYLRLLVAR